MHRKPEGTAILVDGNISFMIEGAPVEYRCIGQEMISVEAGKKFILGLSIWRRSRRR